MNYNFKSIRPIPSADEMINILFSKTQRKTPTVVHPGYSITRIRGFYIRKVKFTQTSYDEKLSEVLQDFPKTDDIHPFYAALINVLYDKDHYKLALGHIHSARQLIDNIAKDYVRLMKYADSLYRCKMLKKAALGRMATMTKKLKASLGFLEEVRKHMGRLPSINPYERTLLITGFPNVGKSSFMNNVTNANVDVQPYPFTTQSLFVGHTDYNYVRWQVIDSPGILDHNLEERNTIEMQAITALAHLKAAILFFIDISESCGQTISQQISLFNNIKPLFQNKPLVIVMTKIDLIRFEELGAEDKAQLEALLRDNSVSLITMSNKSGEGISQVKETACDILLKYRLEQKPDALSGGNQSAKYDEEFLRGMNVIIPKKRDNKNRPQVVPQTVFENKKLERPTLKQVQEEMGGAGVFNFPLQEHFLLANPEWKYDDIPEIMDGKNIADFVDPDILQRLEALEEEEQMMENARQNAMEESEDELSEDLLEAHSEIKNKQALKKIEHNLKKKNRAHGKNRDVNDAAEHLEDLGIDSEKFKQRIKLQKKSEKMSELVKHAHLESDEDQMVDEAEEGNQRAKRNFDNRLRSQSRQRTQGYKEEKTPQQQKFDILRKKIQKDWTCLGKAGDADRHITNPMPRHLFSGKRSFKADRR